ncbi:MAG: ACP S-malonyltransferase [Bacteroidota bacterium]
MPDTCSSFIFPAFTRDYRDHPGQHLPGFEELFSGWLRAGAASADPSLSQFKFSDPAFTGDELRTQYITYIYSCTVAGILRNITTAPLFTAGYSMGIYAALFDAGAIDFETGLELIRIAYHSMAHSTRGGKYGMGTVIGLSRTDLELLTGNPVSKVEIVNQNASHSFVVSGEAAGLARLLSDARAEGALFVNNLDVTVPYHSGFLKEGAEDFSRQISHLHISSPNAPVVSLINQQLLVTPESLRGELIMNLCHPLNWFETQQVMINRNVTLFIECGPSEGLVKNSKFIPGNYRFSRLGSLISR